MKALIGQMKLKENQVQFIPTTKGHHGSRALWETQLGNEEYWEAVNQFLEKVK